ncbi:MAG: hypothetical protein QMD01_03600 [Thermodesulfovibrionales bacterium]|nr:hypothetical protein [Thermodesulfovibrionales bacterium]
MSRSGSKLILIIPKTATAKATELLWQKGIADRVSIGSYEIVVSMP